MINVEYSWSNIAVSRSRSNDPNPNIRHIIEKLWIVRFGKDQYNNCFDVRQAIDLPAPDPNNFIPASTLTKQQMQQWAENILGPQKIAEMDDRIANKLKEIRIMRQQPEIFDASLVP
jgi:hypothetical protein